MHDDKDGLAPELLSAWRLPEPPEFGENRVWKAYVRRRGRGVRAAAAALAIATLGIGVFGGMSKPERRGGPWRARVRTSWRIADRAVAVAEPGTELGWQDEGGRIRVNQRAGNVFYRVDKGGAFEVTTPAGTVRALGTCFRVEVRDMSESRRSLVAAATATLVTGGVLVSVYEGRVALSKTRVLGPGESAVIPSLQKGTLEREAPAREALEARIRIHEETIQGLRAELAETRRAPTPATPPSRPAPAASKWPDEDLQARFDQETRDAPWAEAQEDGLAHRLVEYMDLDADKVDVECKTHCCDVQLAVDDTRQMWPVLRDLKSDIGVGIGRSGWNDLDVEVPVRSRDGLGHIFVCHSRSADEAGELSNRGAERDALLTRAAPALERCRAQLQSRLEVTLDLTVDTFGAISDVQTAAQPVGEAASRCVEAAILSAADFAPFPRPTWFSIRVALDAAEGAVSGRPR
ncbi:MAG: FecR domain-containing protein [Myxococcota bacterium]